MRQRPHHSVAHDAFGAALATPWIRLDHATLDHRPACLDPLPDSFETELVKSAERSEIRRGEGSVEHVEVFQMGSVGTSILEDLDPYPRTSERTPPTPSNAKSPETIRAAGLDRALSEALSRWRKPLAIHDPGKII